MDIFKYQIKGGGRRKKQSTQNTPDKKATKPLPYVKAPMGWLARAAQCSPKALHVAVILHYQSSLEKSKTVKFTRKHRECFGIAAKAARRALQGLENAKLVKVKRPRGGAPIVTILDGPDYRDIFKSHQ